MEVIPNYLRCVISPFSVVNGGLAISNCRSSYVNNGSNYFEMPTDTYSSKNYMLDGMSDLHVLAINCKPENYMFLGLFRTKTLAVKCTGNIYSPNIKNTPGYSPGEYGARLRLATSVAKPTGGKTPEVFRFFFRLLLSLPHFFFIFGNCNLRPGEDFTAALDAFYEAPTSTLKRKVLMCAFVGDDIPLLSIFIYKMCDKTITFPYHGAHFTLKSAETGPCPVGLFWNQGIIVPFQPLSYLLQSKTNRSIT